MSKHLLACLFPCHNLEKKIGSEGQISEGPLERRDVSCVILEKKIYCVICAVTL